MPTVAISVDCEAANAGKCYTRELVRVAEEFTVPLTWLIFVSEKDPMSNINLYHSEYLHRIPAWHEIGLYVGFESSSGPVTDPTERGDLIRVGKDVLKQCHVKPTSFRARGQDLQATDIKALEDIGILVDVSTCNGVEDLHGVVWSAPSSKPYHPSYDDPAALGEAKLLVVPGSGLGGREACLGSGWDAAGPVLEHALRHKDVVVVRLNDGSDCVAALRSSLEMCCAKGSRFVTLTQLASP